MGQKFLAFVIAFFGGSSDKLAIPVGTQLPTFNIKFDVTVFGHTQDIGLSATGTNDNLNLETAPS